MQILNTLEIASLKIKHLKLNNQKKSMYNSNI